MSENLQKYTFENISFFSLTEELIAKVLAHSSNTVLLQATIENAKNFFYEASVMSSTGRWRQLLA